MAVQMKETIRQIPGDSTAPDRALRLCLEKTLGKARGDGFTLSLRYDIVPGITVLFGASGAGKSTVLNCIAGLLRPDSGYIDIGQRMVFDSERHIDMPVERRRVGYVFQNLALFPHLTVLENVGYGIAGLASSERKNRAVAMLERLRIGHLKERRPRDISGGERQRVALARALVMDPSVLLLDEPLSGLDLPTKTRIVDDLRSWNDQHGIPVLYVSHSRDEVFAVADRVLILDKGRVVSEGTPYHVFEKPENELAAELAGFENIFDVTVVAEHQDRGTVTCTAGNVQLEIPLSRSVLESSAEPKVARIGIRAGDILVATSRPEGLSARNLILGRIILLTRRDMIVVAQVDCGIVFEVHVTPHAVESLGLEDDREVWLVMKTHSFNLLRRTEQ